MTEHNNPQDNVTVPRELLRQVIDAACSPYCAQDLGKLIPALRTALEQPDEVKPIASIYISADGEREFDDWKVPLPMGRNELYTAPQASESVLTNASAQPAQEKS